jgi:hypothetical protein
VCACAGCSVMILRLFHRILFIHLLM